GQPNCSAGCPLGLAPCTLPGGGMGCDFGLLGGCMDTGGGPDDPAAIAQAGMSAAAGVKVFVIGIGTDSSEEATLNSLAMMGGVPRASAPYYYPVTNGQDLENALMAITGQIASCNYPLQMPPPDPNHVDVSVNGMPIAEDPTNGWSFGPG